MKISVSHESPPSQQLTKTSLYSVIVLMLLTLVSNMAQANDKEKLIRDGRAGEGLNLVVSIPPLATLVSNLVPSAKVSVLFETEQALHLGSINTHHLKLIRYANLVLSTPGKDEQRHLGQVMQKFKRTRWQVLTQPTTSDHGWLIPTNGISYISQIVTVLSDFKPRQRKLFEQNAIPILDNLRKWDASFKATTDNIDTPIFSVHSALEGFRVQYGLTVHAYQIHGRNPGPTDHEIWLSRAHQMLPCCILAPKSSAENLARRLSTETGTRLFLFEPLSPHLEHTYRTLVLFLKEASLHDS